MAPRQRTVDDSLGRAIAEARGAKQWKRTDLARSTDINYTFLSEIEKGTKRGSEETLEKIADALDTTVFRLRTRAEQFKQGDQPGAVTPPRDQQASHLLAMVAEVDQHSDAKAAVREEAIVSDIVRILRAEITLWLDHELETAVRRAVRAGRVGGL